MLADVFSEESRLCRPGHAKISFFLLLCSQVVSLEELKTSSHPEDLLHRPIFCVEHSYEKLRFVLYDNHLTIGN